MADVHMDNDNQDIPRLRIVHIISGDRWAGAEVQAYALLSEFAKSHDVFAIILNDGELANKLKLIGITVKIFDEAHLSSVKLFFKIRSALYNIKPDIVHTHRQKENILGSIANKLSVNARCVRTEHGAPEFTPKGRQRIQVQLDKICASYLQDSIISVSNDLRSKLVNILGTRCPITVVNNGIDPREVQKNLSVTTLQLHPPQYRHIGIVGRLEPVKRVDIFIAMAEILLNRQLDTPLLFHIFGDGYLKKSLEKKARDLHQQETIIFHGHSNDIRSYINDLDVVIMCSDHEGLPMTALECLALNTPILAHRIGGLTQLLPSNWMTDDHTPEGYANLLLEYLDHPTQYINFPADFHIKRTYTMTLKQYQPKLGAVEN